jgi:hypothetical protein
LRFFGHLIAYCKRFESGVCEDSDDVGNELVWIICEQLASQSGHGPWSGPALCRSSAILEYTQGPPESIGVKIEKRIIFPCYIYKSEILERKAISVATTVICSQKVTRGDFDDFLNGL